MSKELESQAEDTDNYKTGIPEVLISENEMAQNLEEDAPENEQMIKENNAFRESRFTQKQELDIPEFADNTMPEELESEAEETKNLELETPDFIHSIFLAFEDYTKPEELESEAEVTENLEMETREFEENAIPEELESETEEAEDLELETLESKGYTIPGVLESEADKTDGFEVDPEVLISENEMAQNLEEDAPEYKFMIPMPHGEELEAVMQNLETETLGAAIRGRAGADIGNRNANI
ncbi:Hypothetical predicted protein [Octopus vulgaris]|uniref:Uncharacterized protein n=1 Tax=Octopus vulgaris TaxID=6645 RepID=A0AA36AH76_OCTVU|nr:Hypothetical predicted protein [Octopus vulgaris]